MNYLPGEGIRRALHSWGCRRHVFAIGEPRDFGPSFRRPRANHAPPMDFDSPGGLVERRVVLLFHPLGDVIKFETDIKFERKNSILSKCFYFGTGWSRPITNSDNASIARCGRQSQWFWMIMAHSEKFHKAQLLTLC